MPLYAPIGRGIAPMNAPKPRARIMPAQMPRSGGENAPLCARVK